MPFEWVTDSRLVIQEASAQEEDEKCEDRPLLERHVRTGRLTDRA